MVPVFFVDTIKVDGGACANNLLMKFQADISQKKVKRPSVIETTGLGAAYLAGLATGYWKNKEEIKRNMSIDKEFVPQMSKEDVQEKLKGWNKAVKCAIIYSEE